MALEPTFTLVYRTVEDSKISTEVYVPDIKPTDLAHNAKIPLIYIIHGMDRLLLYASLPLMKV